MRWIGLGGAGLALGLLVGCAVRGFRVDGVVASKGANLQTWSWRPQGCIRGAAGGSGVASLLWIDPVKRDASRANQHQYTVEDAPVRLDLLRVGGELVAVGETVRTQGTEFTRANCRLLELETLEERATVPEGRPSLGGRLRMDCTARGSHVTADVQFSGCDY